MTPREPYGIQEPAALRQQRANVCYIETITQSQPSTEVRRQEKPRGLAIGMMIATGLLVVGIIIGLAHLPSVFALADHTYRVGYIHPDCPTPLC